jgi:hypothetical protein
MVGITKDGRLKRGSGSNAIVSEKKNAKGLPHADSMKTPSKREKWLFRNKSALNSVRRGLADSAAGRTTSLGSFSRYV